jgi:glycosyltransferase involved in cell wall biosynthesis
MKILFLVPYPTGEAPSQRFRFEQYFDLLTKNGIHYTVSSFWTKSAWNILYKSGHYLDKIGWLLFGFLIRWIDIIRCIRYDLIFIHRECTPVGPPLCEFIIARVLRKKIIYDFDDAIWLPNTSTENKVVRWIKFHSKVKSICRWSHKVSCGNDWLADYARNYNPNIVINPTTIDTEKYHNPELWSSSKNEKIVIGWTGTHSTIFYLNSMAGILKEIEKKFPVDIHIISNKNPNFDLPSAKFIPWNKENEIEQLIQFDIGVMPLDDDDWAKGKCGFKALQYMALGIPCIASSVGVNKSIIENDRNGILCVNNQDWVNALNVLIENSVKRNEMGIHARKKVIENYSVASNSTNFLSLIKL